MKYSLIVPVYNVAPFLADCIKSLFNQDNMILGEDYEVIFVNDGSTDTSLEVLKSNLPLNTGGGIVVIDQCNSGVSAARNNGLANARGEYVWFIDSDDFIAPNSLVLITHILDCKKYDIVSIKRKTVQEQQKYTREEVLSLQKQVMRQKGANTAINYIVKRKYLLDNEIYFNEKMAYGEDHLWCFWINFFISMEIPRISETIYFYRLRSGSAMHDISTAAKDRHFQSMMVMLGDYRKTLNRYENKYDEVKISNLRHRISWTVDNVLMDAVRMPQQRCHEIYRQLNSQGLINYKLNYNRLSLNSGFKGFLISLISLPIRIKPYYILLNFIFRKLKLKRSFQKE